MNIVKNFSQIILIAIFLSSCRSSMNKENSIKNLEKNINETSNSEKKRMEIKFSCEEDGISEYLDDGWIILKEDSLEKISLGNLFLPQKTVIWKKIKDVK